MSRKDARNMTKAEFKTKKANKFIQRVSNPEIRQEFLTRKVSDFNSNPAMSDEMDTANPALNGGTGSANPAFAPSSTNALPANSVPVQQNPAMMGDANTAPSNPAFERPQLAPQPSMEENVATEEPQEETSEDAQAAPATAVKEKTPEEKKRAKRRMALFIVLSVLALLMIGAVLFFIFRKPS